MAPGTSSGELTRVRVLAVVTGAAALFLAALDFSINVALPVFRDSLGETLVSVQWIIILYHAARSGTGFVAGSIIDLFGLKRLLLVGIVLYTGAVGLISLQGELAPVVALRVPQGIGVAILFTAGPAMVARAFGPGRRGAVLGVTLGAVGAGQMAGTLGGGWLSLNVSWEAIFWARVPIGAAIFLFALVCLPGPRNAQSGRHAAFDWPGAGLLFTFLFVLVLALSFARIDGWTALLPILLYLATAALGLAWGWRQRAAAAPVFPNGLLRVTEFRAGAISNFLVTAGTFVMWYLFPFFVSDVMGRSTLVLGSLLATLAAATLAGSAFGGMLADRLGDRAVTLAGAAIAAGGLVASGTLGDSPSVAGAALAAAFLGLGFGIHQAAVYALTLRNTGSAFAGAASATLAVTQTVGTVTSIAVMTSLLAWRQSLASPGTEAARFNSAYGDVLLIAAAVTLAGGLAAVSLRHFRAILPGRARNWPFRP